MKTQKDVNLIAAILTLSEGMDAAYEVLRRTLSFNAELENNKILERFIPKPITDTKNRFKDWLEIINRDS